MRVTCLVALMLLIAAAPGAAQADVAGEWAVTFETPQGPVEFMMYVNQNGTSLRGRLTSAAGEFPLTGSVSGDKVSIVWELPDQGKLLRITFTATAEGDVMKGAARIAAVGEGPFSAERTSR